MQQELKMELELEQHKGPAKQEVVVGCEQNSEVVRSAEGEEQQGVESKKWRAGSGYWEVRSGAWGLWNREWGSGESEVGTH